MVINNSPLLQMLAANYHIWLFLAYGLIFIRLEMVLGFGGNVHKLYQALGEVIDAADTPEPEHRSLLQDTLKYNVSEEKLVEIKQGIVMGIYREEYRAFNGIPYAMAPVGELRWKPPRRMESFEDTSGIFHATSYGKTCVQFTSDKLNFIARTIVGSKTEEDEDCLNLNIVTPRLDVIKKSENGLPVMVFIHGGTFNTGGNSFPLYQPTKFVSKMKNIIVVNINYRLGLMGYLASKELEEEASGESYGNYGVQDQIMGLEWIKENIAAFGGDPNNITLFGHSAGSISVHYIYMLMSIGKIPKLVHKIICQSGVMKTWPLRDLQTTPTVQLSFDLIAKDLNCYYEGEGVKRPAQSKFKLKDTISSNRKVLSADAILQCMRKKSWKEIKKYSTLRKFDELWGPVADGILIPKNPVAELLMNPMDIPIMFGRVFDEGNVFFFDRNFKSKDALRSIIAHHFPTLYDEINALYSIDGDLSSSKQFKVASKIAGDAFLKCPIQASSMDLANLLPESVYLYRFNTGITAIARILRLLRYPSLGVFHGIELIFLNEVIPLLLNTYEKNVSLSLQERWVLFAQQGNPNKSSFALNWKPVNGKKELSKKCQFWTLTNVPPTHLKEAIFDENYIESRGGDLSLSEEGIFFDVQEPLLDDHLSENKPQLHKNFQKSALHVNDTKLRHEIILAWRKDLIEAAKINAYNNREKNVYSEHDPLKLLMLDYMEKKSDDENEEIKVKKF